jgi:hypothetical protein
MTETTQTRATAPWWFWVVAVVALLWNAFGGYDYSMSHFQGEAYFRQMGMTDAQIAYLDAYPSWMHAVWAIGVWGSVLGSILLILRSRWALYAFALSVFGAIGNLGYLLMNPGGGDLIFPAIIIAICVFLIWFSSTMTKRSVLL